MSLAASILSAGPSDLSGGRHAKLPDLTALSDTALLTRLTGSNPTDAERAFDLLYRAYYSRLVALARSYTGLERAEELVQDVLGRIWERRATFAPASPIGIYLYAATRNAAISAMRHDHVVGRVEHVAGAAGDALGMGGVSRPADVQAEDDELLDLLTAALARLPDGMRTAFTLRWIHELSYAEVAAVMEIAEPAARKQVSRAREAIVPVLKRFVDR